MLLPYALYLSVLSIVTYCLYASDKKKAKKGEWRISEATLLACSFLGGAVGGACAMFFKRHKTKRWYFRAVNALGLIWQFGLLIYLIAKG